MYESREESSTTTTAAGIRFKQKKILPSNPNALIIKWLKEWQKEASEKGSKVQYTYSKALNSLKKYPLPLRSGSECLIIENFGKKMCDMIDKKISQHSAETGLEISDMFDAESERSRSENVTKRTQNPTTNKKPEKYPRLEVHTISSSDENDTEKEREEEKEEEEEEEKEEGKGNYVPSPPPVIHEIDSLTPIKFKSGAKTKAYVPKYRSGPYAVLLTLYRSQKEYMTKEELIQEAQPLSEVSFKSVAGSYYTAWSSVRTLIKKEFVVKQGSPAKYSLTDSGKSVASKLSLSAQATQSISPSKTNYKSSSTISILPSESETFTVLKPVSNSRKFSPTKRNSSNLDTFLRQKPDVEDNVLLDNVVCIGDDDDVCRTDICKEDDTSLVFTNPELVLQPYTFDIVLLVDNCEFYGGSNTNKPLMTELIKNSVNCMLRKLNVGDFLWIARSKHTESEKPVELVLNYIVERKRMDDLSGSIIDGRFREQKFRLKQCGLSHAIYLIEDYGSSKHLSVSEDKLTQAITNTQVIDEFQVKRTENTKESVAYLTLLTRYLQSYYLKKTLYGSNEVVKAKPGEEIINRLDSASEILCNFEDFNNSAAKTKVLTVCEMFAKQLIHFPNMSGAKAFAVTEKWPTPTSLFEAYEAYPDKVSQEKMLCNIKAGKNNRSIGPVLSRKIQEFYCAVDY